MTKPLLKGVLKTWIGDRGFGFLTPDNGGRDVFIHISAIGQTVRPPVPGDIIYYHIIRDKNGKFRAINAHIEGLEQSKASTATPKQTLKWGIALGILFVLAITAAAFYYYQSIESN